MSENKYKEAWDYTMNEIHDFYKSQNNEDDFILWFNKMNYVEDTIDTITISVANPFLKQMIQKKGFFEFVEKKLQENLDQKNLKLNCIIKEDLNNSEAIPSEIKTEKKSEVEKSKQNSKKENESASEKSEKKDNKKHPLLQEEFTFDTFIPGENSNFAYNAALAVSKNPGKKYNPILLYGGSGLGKTHLMQAIGNYIYNNSEEKLKICYVSAESFTNEFTVSIKENKTTAFKNKYRNLDVLLLDDIHFLSEKVATQEELFYTFNALNEKHAQMVFTCDRPIKEIKDMAARLVSRLSNGLCIDLQPPNYETRIAILQKKIDLMGKTLSPEIIDFIAKKIETNVRDLEASLNKVFGYADLVGKTPDLEIAKNLLKDIMDSNNPENISLDTIQKVIADNYQISISDLKSKKRDKKFVIPRQIAIYIARELTEISYKELGDEFGGKDHSTIMTAYKKVSEQIKIDAILESKIKLYIKEIKEYKKS